MEYNSVANQSPNFHTNDETINDFIDFFRGVRKGHLTKYIYFGRTIDWYQQLQKYKPYYLSRTEQKLIQEIVGNTRHAQRLTAYGIGQLLEIGPGTTTSVRCKTIPLLKVITPKHYYAIDSCPQYALTAASYVYKSLQINPNVLCHDAFTNLNLPPTSSCRCIMMLGGTFSNMLPEIAISFLTMLNKVLKKNDYFIISFDSNKHATHLRNAYYNTYTKQLTLTPLRFFKNYSNSQDFDSEAFRVKYHWNEELSGAELLVIPTLKQTFKLENHTMTLDTNLSLVVTFSKKYFLYELSALIEKFKFRLVDSFLIKDNPINLAVFQRQ